MVQGLANEASGKAKGLFGGNPLEAAKNKLSVGLFTSQHALMT